MLNSQQQKRAESREMGKLAAKQIMAVVITALQEMPNDSAGRALLAELRRLATIETFHLLERKEVNRRAEESSRDRVRAPS